MSREFSQRVWRHAHAIAKPRNPKRGPDDADAMWALFCEAVQTSRRWSAPPRTGMPSKSALPESPPEISHFGLQLAAIRGEIDPEDVPQASDKPVVQRTAFQHDAAQLALDLWHRYALNGRRNKRERRECVYAMAQGARVTKLRLDFGISRQAIYKLRDAAMSDMIRGGKF